MKTLSRRCRTVGAVFLLALATAAASRAGQTQSWVQTEFADFEKGISHNLSLRSDGQLTVAPRFAELYDTSTTYLWALAEDSKGNLYTGGGPGAKLFRLTPKGEKKVLAELEGLEIHALAVDRQDRLYAATSPDGKIYRLTAAGKPEVFYDPKAKYIWDMVFDSRGNLLVATGDDGEVHRVAPDGKGAVLFKSDETHARSLAIDSRDNLIVGTEPGGLVIRVSPAGEGFVLYQMAKREVTSVAVARDGAVWAAAVGNKRPVSPYPSVPPQPAAPPPQTAPAATGAAQARPATAAAPPPTLAPGVTALAGGSEVYRIDRDGDPRKMWSHAQDIVYTIGFDAAGHALLGTGNKGYIYRVDSEVLHTVLLNGASTQVTDIEAGRNGRLFAVTGNVGKVYEIGPKLEKEGSIESDVFDSGLFSRWGRLMFDGRGAGISLTARSGNLDQPQKNWSAWSDPITDPKGARVNCPPARFVQWKATLTTDAKGNSPELDEVYLAYLPKNAEPRVEEIEITPANYRFPAPVSLTTPAPRTLSLPPLGRRTPQRSATLSLDTGSSASLTYSKGSMGARWNASDQNGDTLIYRIEIRGAGETRWKLLKDKVREKYITWDSTALPDGEYRLRVTASDAGSNAPGEALSTALESDVFLNDNTPPAISGLAATRNGTSLVVRWKAADAVTNVNKAEYSLDGGEWIVVPPMGGLADSPELSYELTLANVAPGEHTIAVRVEDEYDNQSTEKTVVRQ